MLIAQGPLRVSLFGGGSDLPAFLARQLACGNFFTGLPIPLAAGMVVALVIAATRAVPAARPPVSLSWACDMWSARAHSARPAQAAAAARGALVPVDASAYYWGGPDQAPQPDPADAAPEPAAAGVEA